MSYVVPDHTGRELQRPLVLRPRTPFMKAWPRSVSRSSEKAGHLFERRGSFSYLIASGDFRTDRRAIRSCLREAGRPRFTPVDWCCARNFQVENRPRMISLPSGRGPEFCGDMGRLVSRVSCRLRRTLASEGFRERIDRVRRGYARQELRLARSRRDGIPGPGPESADPLDAHAIGSLHEIRSGIRELKRCCAREIDLLTLRTARKAIASPIGRLRKKYRGFPKVLVYLDDLEEDILENLTSYTLPFTSSSALSPSVLGRVSPNLSGRVTVLSGGPGRGSAPMILARDPDREELVGSFRSKQDPPASLKRPYTVRGGLLHEANGGCLVLKASWIILNIHLWELIKKTMARRELSVEEAFARAGIFASKVRASEAMPLDLSIVIIGGTDEYAVLSFVDPEFSRLVGEPRVPGDSRGQRCPDELPARDHGLPCHPGARRAVLQLCARVGMADGCSSGHFKAVAGVIGKARAYAGTGQLSTRHVLLAIRDAYPESAVLRRAEAVAANGPAPDGSGARANRAQTITPQNHYEGRVRLYGE